MITRKLLSFSIPISTPTMIGLSCPSCESNMFVESASFGGTDNRGIDIAILQYMMIFQRADMSIRTHKQQSSKFIVYKLIIRRVLWLNCRVTLPCSLRQLVLRLLVRLSFHLQVPLISSHRHREK